jgi:excisionase family DNA binding protein
VATNGTARVERLTVIEAVPRLALRKAEAAESIGVSVDHFERYVQPEIRAVYSGARRLFPVTELARWLEREAQRCRP